MAISNFTAPPTTLCYYYNIVTLDWPPPSGILTIENRDRKEKPTPIAIILVFSILTAGIATSGYVYYRNYEKRYRVEVERQLSIIGNLNASELALWRKERLGDGHVLSKNLVFCALVRRYIENPGDVEAKELLQSWLRPVQVSCGHCRVFLLDSLGVERTSVPDTHEPVPSHLLQDLPEILRSEEVNLLDFHREAQDRPVHLPVVVPILDDQKRNRAIGLLVLDIGPEHYLYPFISRWPTPSRTAETLLVRPEGNDALFLSQLKFQKNTASICAFLWRTETWLP
jgi:two-component system, cell cycle sensor histidine kinase and response regulator CckA